MTTRCFATALVSAVLQATSAPAGSAPLPASLREYRVDFGHSIVEFSIDFAFSRVKGRFTSANGTILYDEAHPERSSVTMVIDAKSIDTGWPHRDEHLRTADFFDVETHPEMTLRSTGISERDGDYVLAADLTIAGVTRPVEFALEFDGVTQDPFGNTKAGFEASTEINRSDWGLSFNMALETGGVLVSEKIRIDLDVQLVRS